MFHDSNRVGRPKRHLDDDSESPAVKRHLTEQMARDLERLSLSAPVPPPTVDPFRRKTAFGLPPAFSDGRFLGPINAAKDPGADGDDEQSSPDSSPRFPRHRPAREISGTHASKRTARETESSNARAATANARNSASDSIGNGSGDKACDGGNGSGGNAVGEASYAGEFGEGSGSGCGNADDGEPVDPRFGRRLFVVNPVAQQLVKRAQDSMIESVSAHARPCRDIVPYVSTEEVIAGALRARGASVSSSVSSSASSSAPSSASSSASSSNSSGGFDGGVDGGMDVDCPSAMWGSGDDDVHAAGSWGAGGSLGSRNRAVADVDFEDPSRYRRILSPFQSPSRLAASSKRRNDTSHQGVPASSHGQAVAQSAMDVWGADASIATVINRFPYPPPQ